MSKRYVHLLIFVLGIFLLFFGLNVKFVFAYELNDGLVGYWRLDDNKTIDYFGKNNLINNGAISTYGFHEKIDTAFYFSNAKSSSLYISDTNQSNLDVLYDMSVSVWIKLASFPSNGKKYAIVTKYNEGLSQRSYFYSLYNDNGIYKMQGILAKTGWSALDMVSPPVDIKLNTWYNFVWVYNSAFGRLEYYIDGEKVGESFGGPSSINNSNVSFQIGGYDYYYKPYFFDGTIDEVRIYNRVLSDEEIAELYNQFKGEEPAPQPENFSFVHLADPHLGSSRVPGHRWYEELSYPRFTDGLYEISRLAVKPDFLLVSGDTVEYAEERWLRDYRSLADSFSAQTGIKVYTVPGNHDRYRGAAGSFFCQGGNYADCDDSLSAYQSEVSDAGDEYFEHKGLQFIGLDSGADFMPDFEVSDLRHDKGIESAGLADAQMSDLTALGSSTPKVLFMHASVYNGGNDECADSLCPQNFLEDASFVRNRDEFLDWTKDNNLQLALTGHGHRDEAYDWFANPYFDIANASDTYPLFVQTQSTTKDSGKNHGYRMVVVQDGAVIPQAVFETGEHVKIISRLEGDGDNELRVYDPLVYGKYITPKDSSGLTVPFFAAESSKRVLLYGADDNKIKLQVRQTDPDSQNFDLTTRIEGVAMDDAGYSDDFGYRIGSIFGRQFVHFHLENKLADIEAKNISFADSNRYQFKADWNELARTRNIDYLRISKDFTDSSDIPMDLEKMRFSLIARIFSPAELAVINSAGERTGIIGHESAEEIGYALSDEERERVLLYSDDDFAGEDLIYRVVGVEDIYDAEDDNFSLKIVHRADDVIVSEVNVLDMPINASTTYQFRVDWDNLTATRGVIMEIDEDGDGIFEIRVEFGQEIADANPRQLRKEMLLRLAAVKNGGILADAKIDAIINLIGKSLNDGWWENDYYLDEKTGDNVFKTDSFAVQKLRLFLGLDQIMDDKLIPGFIQNKLGLTDELASVFAESLEGLLRSDMLLARIAVNDFAASADDKKTEKILKTAEDKLDKAIQVLDKNKMQYLEFCRQGWRIVN